jgi:hypothetical protein
MATAAIKLRRYCAALTAVGTSLHSRHRNIWDAIGEERTLARYHSNGARERFYLDTSAIMVIRRPAPAHGPSFAPSLNPFGNRIVVGWHGTAARERVTDLSLHLFTIDALGRTSRAGTIVSVILGSSPVCP